METPKKQLHSKQMDEPQTESTMFGTATPGQHLTDRKYDVAPLRDFFMDDDDQNCDFKMSPASPVNRKNRFDQEFLLQAPSKQFHADDNRYDLSPCEFDMDLELFDTQDELLRVPTTPEKRKSIQEPEAPKKARVQLQFTDVEPIEFDLSKKLFTGKQEFPCFDHLLDEPHELEELDVDCNIRQAPKKNYKRTDFYLTKEEEADLDIDLTKTLFPAEECAMPDYDMMFSDEEDMLAPSIMKSRQKAKPEFFATCQAGNFASMLVKPSLESPSISSTKQSKFCKEKSFDGSIGKVRRNGLYKATNKV